MVFVGRLVTDKGVDVLLKALAALRHRDFFPSVAIIGRGPEEETLRALSQRLTLSDQVQFLGGLPDDALVETLNEAKLMVVPTVLNEGFGVVALEGMACGCVVVGSDDGGLPEAIGPGGRIFPAGDAQALADTLAALLSEPQELDRLRAAGSMHVAKHTAAAVAARYLAVFSRIIDA